MTTPSSEINIQIRFPETIPVEGHFASMAFLDEHGFLDNSGDFRCSLERAGFSLVDSDTGHFLDVAKKRHGLFEDGVGQDAVVFLSLLASEGFAGLVGDDATGRIWHLADGRAVEVGRQA